MNKHSGRSFDALARLMRTVPLLCAFALLSFTSVIAWPVDILEIRLAAPPSSEEQTLVFSAPAPLGFACQTRMLHSVQLTPVIDVYRVQEGRIWAWQERIMSHNAGLPSLAPRRGRFISDPPWMIMEGGGVSWREIYYRVGTEHSGRNELCAPPGAWADLWRLFPGQRLIFFVNRNILFAAMRGARGLHVRQADL